MGQSRRGGSISQTTYYKGNGYKPSALRLLGSFGCTSVTYDYRMSYQNYSRNHCAQILTHSLKRFGSGQRRQRNVQVRLQNSFSSQNRFKSLLSPVSLSVFSLAPDLLFDYSRALEYAKIRTVSQSTCTRDALTKLLVKQWCFYSLHAVMKRGET